MAVCIDSSAGIRGVRSAKCKVTLLVSLTEQHSAVSPGTDPSSLWRPAADSSWCTYRGNVKYTSCGADCPAPDTSHLFSVLPFPPLPILWNVAFLSCITMEFHCIPLWYVLNFTCIFSRLCLQYASVLQAGIIFQAINWLLFFYILEQKGPLLVGSVIKHTFTTTQNMKLLHILCKFTYPDMTSVSYKHIINNLPE